MPPFRLSSHFARDSLVDGHDARNLQRALSELRLFEPRFGFNGIPDEPLVNALSEFQRNEGLEPNGQMAPGDETEARINRRIEEQRLGGVETAVLAAEEGTRPNLIKASLAAEQAPSPEEPLELQAEGDGGAQAGLQEVSTSSGQPSDGSRRLPGFTGFSELPDPEEERRAFEFFETARERGQITAAQEAQLQGAVETNGEGFTARDAAELVLGVLPITGNIISVLDASHDVKAMTAAANRGDWKGFALNGGILLLDLAGALPGAGIAVRAVRRPIRRKLRDLIETDADFLKRLGSSEKISLDQQLREDGFISERLQKEIKKDKSAAGSFRNMGGELTELDVIDQLAGRFGKERVSTQITIRFARGGKSVVDAIFMPSGKPILLESGPDNAIHITEIPRNAKVIEVKTPGSRLTEPQGNLKKKLAKLGREQDFMILRERIDLVPNHKKREWLQKLKNKEEYRHLKGSLKDRLWDELLTHVEPETPALLFIDTYARLLAHVARTQADGSRRTRDLPRVELTAP